MPSDKIWLSSPHMGSAELEFVQEAFATNWIAPLGPHVDGFEKDLEKFTGSAHAAALSSGTAALHLALILAGVSPGDEVICQSFTFSASANPIAYLGAFPVFVDSEAETWNMCPVLLENAILHRLSKAKKPKAIIPVHLYGMPAKMDEISAVAKKYDIPMLEDAAEALGSRYHNRSMGTFGEMGILSFNGNKIITTSGGGALLSENAELIARARFLATQARDNAPHYQHSQIGYNYRMSNVSAAIGRGQMQVLDDRVNARRDNFNFYQDILGGIAGVSFLPEPAGHYSNRWLTTILIDPRITGGRDREGLRLSLLEENIETRPLWKPMHMQPVFASASSYLNGVSEELFAQGLCLPSGSNLKTEERERVASLISSFFQ